jgi:hypothetical protein
MTQSTIKVTNIHEFLATFIKFPLESFYARGEPKEYKTKFMPSIWRPGHEFTDRSPIKENTTFTVGELKSLEQCQEDVLSGKLVDKYFLKFINDPSAPIDIENEELLQWAALAQHYNRDLCHPTRLIDLTKDPLVALYFAINSYPYNNGFVYYFKGKKGNFNEITPENTKWGGTYFDVEEVNYPDDKYPCTPGPHNVAIAKTPYPNRRIEAQRGAFGWTTGIEISCNNLGELPIEIPAKNKPDILEELRRLNYDDYTLFPD